MSLVLQGIEPQFPVVKYAVEGPIAGRMVLSPIRTKHVTYRTYPLAFVNHISKPSAAATFSNFTQSIDLSSGRQIRHIRFDSHRIKGPVTQNAVCRSGLRSLSAAECYILSRLFYLLYSESTVHKQ